jgi:hypothetical protein
LDVKNKHTEMKMDMKNKDTDMTMNTTTKLHRTLENDTE